MRIVFKARMLTLSITNNYLWVGGIISVTISNPVNPVFYLFITQTVSCKSRVYTYLVTHISQVSMNFAPFRGNRLLFDFYFKNLHQIKALPKWMRNPDSLIEEVESKWQNGKNQSFTLELPKTIAQSYNEKFDKMKAEMRKLHVNESEKLSYKNTLILLTVKIPSSSS